MIVSRGLGSALTGREEPYVTHELVGPLGRPGEKALAGTTDPNAK